MLAQYIYDGCIIVIDFQSQAGHLQSEQFKVSAIIYSWTCSAYNMFCSWRVKWLLGTSSWSSARHLITLCQYIPSTSLWPSLQSCLTWDNFSFRLKRDKLLFCFSISIIVPLQINIVQMTAIWVHTYDYTYDGQSVIEWGRRGMKGWRTGRYRGLAGHACSWQWL